MGGLGLSFKTAAPWLLSAERFAQLQVQLVHRSEDFGLFLGMAFCVVIMLMFGVLFVKIGLIKAEPETARIQRLKHTGLALEAKVLSIKNSWGTRTIMTESYSPLS